MTSTPDVQSLLGLREAPIAIGFLDEKPPGVPAYDGGEVPAGCSFWPKAASRSSFYTEPAAHFGCAVGAHTHGIPLPAERAKELEQAVCLMVDQKYIQMSEVPGIPTLKKTPRYVAYGPASAPGFPADVVLVGAAPAQAMLLYEAALRAGATGPVLQGLGRPACAVLPLTASTGAAALSFGCQGNRVFTGLPDAELYFAVPAARWAEVAEQLPAIVAANRGMETYYRQKASTTRAD